MRSAPIRRRHRGQGTGGFSLVEVLCAISILGVGIVGISEGITIALRSSKESEYQTKAALLAAGRIETLRAEGMFLAGEEEGDFGAESSLFRWRQRIIETPTAGLHEVTVTIEMSSSGEMASSGKEVYELKTLLFKVPYEPASGAAKTPDERRAGRSPGRRGEL